MSPKVWPSTTGWGSWSTGWAGAVVVVGEAGQPDRANGSAPAGLDPQVIAAAREMNDKIRRLEREP